MKHDNDIDKLLRDAADNFELPYEDAHWAKFQQMQAASVAKGSAGSKFLLFLKATKWWILAAITFVSAGIYMIVSQKDLEIADKNGIEKAVTEEHALSGDKPIATAGFGKEVVNENRDSEALSKPSNNETHNERPIEESHVSKPSPVSVSVKKKKAKHEEVVTENVAPKVVSTKRSTRKAAKKAEKNKDEIYVFPQTVANTANISDVSKSTSEKPPEAEISKRGTVIENKKENTNKLYEDFVVDETPVEPVKEVKPVVKPKAGGALSDTIFERNLTSTAYTAKEVSPVAEKPSAKQLLQEEKKAERPDTAISHEFSVDAVAGAALYKSLYAGTDALGETSDDYAADLFVGARIEYGLTDKLSLFMQPVYQQRGNIKATATATETNYGFDKSERTFTMVIDKLHYIEVPIGVAFKVFEKHKIYAGAGIAYLMSTSAKVKEFDETETKVQTGYSNGIKNIDYYLLLAYQYEVLRRLRLFAQYQYAPAAAIDKQYYTNSKNSTNSSVKIGLSLNLYNNK